MKLTFAKILSSQIKDLSIDEIYHLIEVPKHSEQGDLSFPVFKLSQILRKARNLIAREVVEAINDPIVVKKQAVGGYVNIFYDASYLGGRIVSHVLQQGDKYGAGSIGHNKVITMDISSPNIAKPFSMGHLRSTVIGNSMALISEKLGYQVVKINHLGDWGTQFGKLIVAYDIWGDEAKVKAEPIAELFKLYVRFHEEAKTNDELNEQGRAAFLKLEQGDKRHVALWTWFREVSLESFNAIYKRLGVTFDSYNGEAFYNDKMDQVVNLLKEKGLLVQNQGAEIVELEDMPPALIKKNNGSTLYITRDLATAIYRKHTYQFNASYYFVGNEQSLHFNQLKKVLELMGYDWSEEMRHIPFGMILKDGKKMSTRGGKVVFLESVLDEAVRIAKEKIQEKSSNVEDIDSVAEQIGIGAVIFNDLKTDRQNDVEFNLEEMLRAEGNTCLYLQYTNARINAIIEKSGLEQPEFADSMDVEAWEIVKQLDNFEEVIVQAFNKQSPAEIAKFLLQLARHFNHYYNEVRILDDEVHLNDRISLLYAVSSVITEGLRLLGIQAPNRL